ncbi:hypothetical protein MAM1_0084c04651 [Mucor ambiguus]|uniref:Uncharacterized protein n=1 Tax=Mucor ambiguus TaxID=91626 RepID=A0A0C9MPK0_9FUNG|nr:hypothetical protein MAM1_0084c04651 [Mucor ambiguus]
MSLISLHFQTWTPDHVEDSFSKNLLDQFDQKMNQDLNPHLAMDQSDINMSDTTYEEDDDEPNFSSIASSQHLNDINRTSTLTSTSSFKIKEHDNPSTSAAAVVAAARAASKQSSLLDSDSCCSSAAISIQRSPPSQQPPQPQRKQNILKKSSMYFSGKIMSKKSTLFTKPSAPTTTTAPHDGLKRKLDQKRRSSPGITIKSQQPPSNVKMTPWWRRLNNYLIPRDAAH